LWFPKLGTNWNNIGDFSGIAIAQFYSLIAGNEEAMPRRTIPITTERNQEGLRLNTILIPCDFSASSEHAFRWAVGLAEVWEAKLIMLHVIPVFSLVDDLQARFLFDFPRMETALLSESKIRLAECTTRNAKSTVAVDIRVAMGDAWWEICRAAERESVDLIVMGSHGHTSVADLALGSVAERVVRHASCPVLVVRLPDQMARRKGVDVVP
jgi:nucleotide-binding universal stress UspA family protein